MKDICIDNFNKYLDKFEDVEVDADDYDALCKYNKENENRKGISSFFVNLMIYEVVDTKSIYNLLFKIFEKVVLITKDLKYEYFENISVIFTDGKDKLYEDRVNFDKFKEKIIEYSKSDDINRKTKYKCLDIIEMIEELEDE